MNQKTHSRILISIRFFLGVLFLVSGIAKILNNEDAKYLVELMASEFYWMIEYRSELVIAMTIIELILAVFLLIGKQLRVTFIASFIFIAGLSSVLIYLYFQGYNVESCGCFGSLIPIDSLGVTIVKNIVLLILIGTGYYFTFPKKENPIIEEKIL